ncbi:hypothetical protein FNU76_12030 [Chitinimonas arctica]|uniref:Uncharacterized protein n=1 Tax=Chitinimonas arctica TaxID=2594795 RepID=A0A516SG10_9NEIS|nr:hypothetical protein [Chitinimonas arctica]QDQ27030.1 hypothetical protein FNU76_12030 [Chitinimonas arctica]
MMQKQFDRLLILISTDSLAKLTFPDCPEEDIEKVKKAARAEIMKLLDGGENYYLSSDFTDQRRQNTYKDFFSGLVKLGASAKIQEKIRIYSETLEGITDSLSTASYTLGSASALLYWLHTDDCATPITDELVDLVAQIEHIGLEIDTPTITAFEHDEIWFDNPTEWDRFVQRILDEVPDAPCYTFNEAMSFSSKLSYLGKWKEYLGEEHYAPIRNWIISEAHARLDEINPDAAKEIDKLIHAY